MEFIAKNASSSRVLDGGSTHIVEDKLEFGRQGKLYEVCISSTRADSAEKGGKGVG